MATYIIIGGNQKEYGPITGSDVRLWISEGRLNENTPAKAEGEADWRPLATFPEFADLFVARTPAAIVPASAVTDAPVNWSERDYDLDVGGCISQAWELYKKNFGLMFVSFLVFILAVCAFSGTLGLFVAMLVPKHLLAAGLGRICFNLFFSAVAALVMGPLLGGLYYVYLKIIRSQPAGVADIFAGFQKAFSQLFLGHLVMGLVAGLCMVPFNIASAVKLTPLLEQMQNASPADVQNLLPQVLAAFVGVLPVLCLCLIPATYLSVNWQFTLPLIIDKQMNFGEAMKVSWKMVHKHWWQIFGLGILVGLVSMAGVFACCIGILFTIPMGFAALMVAYEKIFSSPKN